MYSKLTTFWRLGLTNLIWVVIYRIALKVGFVTRNMAIGTPVKGDFFSIPEPVIDSTLSGLDLKVFGWIEYSKKKPPVWHQSVTSKQLAGVQSLHWSKISDFDLDIGDIKSIWELSRFDWLFYFVIEFVRTGDTAHLADLNSWVADWSKNNAINQGINWKCGQEASIRVMHLCLACYLLQQHKQLSPAMITLLEQHLARISPTVLYAMAQDNNHGTSEAAALYIGGLILEHNNKTNNALKWKKQGLYWLENRAARLIAQDGSFSQHSVNYHRVMLDSFCLAEFFRQQFDQQAFSRKLYVKLKLATDWLRFFTDVDNGDAPNLGANDGAKLMPLSDSDYRDYRPTVQLASALFYHKVCYPHHGSFNQPLKLLGLNVDELMEPQQSQKQFDCGGYVFLQKADARVYIRYPVFKFRPSQCDIFHVDFWNKGQNIFRDAGTYSYNTEKKWLDYFAGTSAHNTAQFDDSEQMPRLSRFLYSDWLKTSSHSNLTATESRPTFKAAYKSRNHFRHQREISLSQSELIVIDDVEGFKDKVVIRWRLPCGRYSHENDSIIADDFTIKIEADVELKRVEIVEGWESRYYMEKSKSPILEIEVEKPARIISKINWITKKTK